MPLPSDQRIIVNLSEAYGDIRIPRSLLPSVNTAEYSERTVLFVDTPPVRQLVPRSFLCAEMTPPIGEYRAPLTSTAEPLRSPHMRRFNSLGEGRRGSETSMGEKPSATTRVVAGAPGAPVVFLRDDGPEETQFVTIQRSGSVTLRELAEEYSISSVLECDAMGHVQPRAVTFDSPSDVLHGGKYYIARRDVRHAGLPPRVTFRGKILVEEFDLDHSLLHQKENNSTNPTTNQSGGAIAMAQPTLLLGSLSGRKRQERKEETEQSSSEAGLYKFVPFFGDLYGNGHEDHIQLHDVKRLCDNFEGDEIEYNARHARALATIQQARKALLPSQTTTAE